MNKRSKLQRYRVTQRVCHTVCVCVCVCVCMCVYVRERERERDRIPKSKKKHKTGRTPLYFFPSLTVSWEMSSNVVEAAFAEWPTKNDVTTRTRIKYEFGQGILKWGSIAVLLTSCLTGLD
jgi:cytochrome b subunit of formate dehydrogenase